MVQWSIVFCEAYPEIRTGPSAQRAGARHGHRTISLPASAVELLGSHRCQQIEQPLMLGRSRLGPDDLVFALPDGSPYPLDKLSRDWGNTVAAKKLPQATFHVLRHSSASALIAAGLDVVSVSRRLGHGSPAITLTVCAHMFSNTDTAGASDRGGDAAAGLKKVPGASWVPIPRFVLRAPVLSHCRRSDGEVPERSNGAVSKTVVPLTGDRGFESLPLRQPPRRRPREKPHTRAALRRFGRPRSKGAPGPPCHAFKARKVYLAGGIAPGGGGGAGGLEKLPACRRASSSWFSWFAVLPPNFDAGACLIATL